MFGKTKNLQSGQTTLEYILLLAIIVSLFAGFAALFSKNDISNKLTDAVQNKYRRAYQFGNVKTKGFEDDIQEHHPRIVGGNNFRIFINPPQ